MSKKAPTHAELAKPFYYRRGKVGILLLHGFTSTPYIYRELAIKLAESDYTVSAPLIEGHGTSPEELEKTTWKDWVTSAETAFDILKKDCNEILVIGASFGANLACHVAANRKVDGLVLIGVPRWLHKHWLIVFGTHIYSLLGIRFFSKPIAKTLDEDIIIAGPTHSYVKIPIKSMKQILYLMSVVTERNLRKITAPTLIIQSVEDGLIMPSSGRFAFNHLKSKNKQLIWISESHHELHTGQYRRLIYSFITDFMLSWS
jgi:carboxylesterase